jgi:hypothetical protein
VSNEYPIETLADFLTVSEPLIDACLADFKQWIALARNTASITSQVNLALGTADAAFLMHSFTWIDDGTVGIKCVDIYTTGESAPVRINVAPQA